MKSPQDGDVAAGQAWRADPLRWSWSSSQAAVDDKKAGILIVMYRDIMGYHGIVLYGIIIIYGIILGIMIIYGISWDWSLGHY